MPPSEIRALFLLYRPEIERFLFRRLACADTAADLTQETFYRLLQHNGGKPIENSRAFLFKIAANLANDHVRKRRRQRTQVTEPEALAAVADQSPTMDATIAGRQRLAQLRAAIEELPPRTQEIFALNRLEGLTYQQVAQRLGVSESAVQKHLSAALLHATRRIRRNSDKS